MNAAQAELLGQLTANEFDLAFRRRAHWLVDALAPEPGHEVLDLGCGHGWYLHALSRLVPGVRLTGLDGDPDRVADARALGAGDVVCGDAQRLPFADASFDRVLMAEVLEHLPDDAHALAEVRRVLRPGGVLALSVPHADHSRLWDPVNPLWMALGGRPIRNRHVAGIWANHERLYRPGELAGRAAAAGLEVERVDELTHYAFPFTALLVYSVGKPLLEHGVLPGALARSADRFAAADRAGERPGPLDLLRRPFEWVDALNDRAGVRRRRTWVNVVLRARRP